LLSPFEELIFSTSKNTLRRFMVDNFQDIVNKLSHSKEQEGGIDEDV
jgi:hypothetical protein